MAEPVLTLQEAADLLGVHYMTAYRYVRLGLLPATKPGGAWQVARADVERFHAAGSATSVAPGTRRRAPWAERMEARLVAGDTRGAWGVVEAALTAGASIDEIYLDVITPAMHSIGARWAAGELDVSVEHRATGIAFRLVGRLGPRFTRRGRTRGTVVVGAPQGERHALAAAIVADLLRGEGWAVSDLGSDLPVESFVRAAQDAPGLVAVAVSVTVAENLPATAELLGALRVALTPEVVLAVGGGAVRDRHHAETLGADVWTPSAHALVERLSERPSTDRTHVR